MQKIVPVLGILIFALLSGTVSEVSALSANLKSNAIVLLGTLICCMISYPMPLFADLVKSVRQAFARPLTDYSAIIDQIQKLAVIRRRQGTLALDKESHAITHPFLKMGVEMVADGYDRYTIFKTLERRYDSFLVSRRSQSDLMNTMIKLLPVFGFVGTIIGLINVLNNMGSPEVIGKGVATALLTTFYGLLYANILFLPVAKKLAEQTRQDSVELALIIEGVLDISEKVNARLIGYRLRYCVGEFYQDDKRMGDQARPDVKLPELDQKIPGLGLNLKPPVVR